MTVQKAQNSKIPKFFVFAHGMLDPYFQLAKGRKMKAMRNSLYWQLIERKIINQADQLLFATDEECRLAATTFGSYYPRKQSVVGLGVESPPPNDLTMRDLFRNKCPQIGNSPYLLFLSRLNEKKGVDNLIKTYTDVAAKTNHETTLPKLVIAGPGLESSYGRKLQQLATDFKESIFFTGMLTGSAKWGAFYGCEAFILPTHQENFGIAIAEALACGKPVLISNQANIWREIENNEAGIVSTDTAAGTQRLLQTWLKKTSHEKEQYGKNALATYEKHFSPDLIVNRWINILN
jgi:glycosyltransferase involved in cell wall biosynthesis